MSKPNIAQNQFESINSETSKVKARVSLTPKQREFLADYADFVQKYNTPALAELFNTSRQNVKAIQNKREKSKYE